MEADFENAIKGITKAFCYSMDGRPNGFFQGIPTSCFDEIFCWRVAEHHPSDRQWDSQAGRGKVGNKRRFFQARS
jgi:hypothetical protein